MPFIKHALLSVFLTIMFGCAQTEISKPIQRVALIEPVPSLIEVSASPLELERILIQALSRNAVVEPEDTFLKSPFKQHFKDVNSKFSMKDLHSFVVEKKYHSAYMKNNDYVEGKLKLVRLELPFQPLSPSFRINNVPPKIRGGFLIYINNDKSDLVKIAVKAHDIKLIGDETCGFHMHGFGCGNKTKSVNNEPLIQYRILMYIYDVLQSNDFQPKLTMAERL